MARYPKGTTPKLTEELIECIAASIRSGSYIETSAALSGINKDTFYRWLKQAESDEATDLHQKLSDAVKKAMAEAETRDLADRRFKRPPLSRGKARTDPGNPRGGSPNLDRASSQPAKRARSCTLTP